MAGTLMLLDGASLWFRSFYAIPEKLTAPDGRPVNAVRGFVDTIAALVTTHEPTRLVVCLDLDWRPAFRTDLIGSYKAQRVAQDTGREQVPDSLPPQVDMILELLRCAGIATAGADGCEADDVIGTLTDREDTDDVIVVSGDRDLLQVVADDPVRVRVYYVGRGLAKAELMGPDEVAAKYGLPVTRAGAAYTEMAILRGDPSDGLPGVPGIGDKTASTLLTRFGSLDALLTAAGDSAADVPARARKSLVNSVDYIDAARIVAAVKRDATITVGYGAAAESATAAVLPTEPADSAGLASLVEELGVGAAVGRLGRSLGWTEFATR
ncbi:5'-3' exonuclease [Gordonia shandongensis]|uniref:5'-3' exonuclease n=1 Tax=Gordonia shandongensis TaxID=376351 RepID=UPI000417F17C|nr:5'-3' exonuclease [Gordonia shandongensis]